MREQSKKKKSNNNSNSNNIKKKKEETRRSYEYTYCRVCRINHDQGRRRHKYFTSHVSSLSSLLSKFLSNLRYIRPLLTDPIASIHVSSSNNRFWCVFCEQDVFEPGCGFPCGNAIYHLASADHLKKLKSFMWEFGGKMDQVESFRVSEEDLAKWEKKCKTLNIGAASEDSGRPLTGPTNDIHNKLNSVCVNSNQKNINHFVSSNFPNCVMPLQYHTNERYQVCNSELVGSACNASTSCFTANARCSKKSSGHMDNEQSLVCNDNKWAGNIIFSNGGLYQAHNDTGMVDRGSCLQGLDDLTEISLVVQGNEGNVHTGAPPPWFDSSEKSLLEVGHKFESESSNIASSHQKSGKIQKLNPKRVGAAWAEKRKIELEMEKRGEVVSKNFDDNWLPNFGSVWQAGTRKESKKEFNAEKKLPLKTVPQSDTLIEIQPYVSKRKRKDMGNEV